MSAPPVLTNCTVNTLIGCCKAVEASVPGGRIPPTTIERPPPMDLEGTSSIVILYDHHDEGREGLARLDLDLCRIADKKQDGE